jgi:hypothetical protein
LIGTKGSGLQFRWSHEDPGSHIWQTVVNYYPHKTTGKPDISKAHSLALRILSHFLVDRIPEEGISELCESIGRIYEFYSTRGSIVHSRPSVRLIQGKRGQAYERPDFVIEE